LALKRRLGENPIRGRRERLRGPNKLTKLYPLFGLFAPLWLSRDAGVLRCHGGRFVYLCRPRVLWPDGDRYLEPRITPCRRQLLQV